MVLHTLKIQLSDKEDWGKLIQDPILAIKQNIWKENSPLAHWQKEQ